jgi:eukaryotic-like serine/threonine-protein kinase
MIRGVGATIDRYQLIEHVATRGPAEVYRARSVDDGGEVTVKVPSLETLTDRFVEGQWCRESALTERFARDVVQCRRDVGEVKSEQYLVFDPTPDLSLRQVLSSDEPLPFERVLRWGLDLARAIGYLHSLGLIHRDVRPDNIYIRADSTLQLASSGHLERSSGWDRSGPPDPSGPAAAYLSRELRRGDAGDPRSDVYSWGVTMHELVASSIRTHPSAASSGLGAAILIALEPSPFDRYPDGIALADALSRLVG